MVDVYQSYPSVCILKLVILAVGGQIDIRALLYRRFDELGSATSAQSDCLHRLFCGARVAYVGALLTLAYETDEIGISHRFLQLADDAQTRFAVRCRN